MTPGSAFAPAAEGGPAAIAAESIHKSFGGVHALEDASFSVSRGSIHALVGENGAGKSTLIKILGGRLPPDRGRLTVDGGEVHFSGTADAARRGIATVFQELTLLPYMTVAENLLIRREPRTSLGLIDRRRLPTLAQEALAGLGIHHIDTRALAAEVSLAERQIIEICRELLNRPKVLLLDEPTSALVEREVSWLFDRMRAARDDGTAIVFTSHRWHEISAIADTITIFRNGTDVGRFHEIDEEEAIGLMTGKRIDAIFPSRPPAPSAEARPLLELKQATAPEIAPVDLSLKPGEILGVGGLAGHGHRTLFFGIFGAPGFNGGELLIEGQKRRIASPRDAIRAGIALVPEDRKSEGLFLPLTIRDNLTLPILKRLSRFGLIQLGAERKLADASIARLAVRTPGPLQPVGALSGGNQQKVLLGRWLETNAKILLFYDITRGVDVATKSEIYDLVIDLAKRGFGILFYSSDAEELAHLCHRVLVMRRGAVVADLPGEGLDATTIVGAAMREARDAA